KHAFARFAIPTPDGPRFLFVVNLHLRSSPEGEVQRTRQARTVHYYIADLVRAGQNVIVLGDTNTELLDDAELQSTDIGALTGLDTPDTEDDLIDLHSRLPEDQRATHLLNKQFDRILVSPSVLEDDPDAYDISFAGIKNLKSLATPGGVDEPQEHWDNYWTMPEDQRDLSDHWPLVLRLKVK
ncbi:MAG: endonuclease, partial [Planctomycetota bacterium]